jgi:hypothetical protein
MECGIGTRPTINKVPVVPSGVLCAEHGSARRKYTNCITPLVKVEFFTLPTHFVRRTILALDRDREMLTTSLLMRSPRHSSAGHYCGMKNCNMSPPFRITWQWKLHLSSRAPFQNKMSNASSRNFMCSLDIFTVFIKKGKIQNSKMKITNLTG